MFFDRFWPYSRIPDTTDSWCSPMIKTGQGKLVNSGSGFFRAWQTLVETAPHRDNFQQRITRPCGHYAYNEAKRLRELEAENEKLKKLLADQMLENTALKDVVSKKW